VSRTRRAKLLFLFRWRQNHNGRDKKSWWKPDKSFKKMQKKKRRAEVRAAMAKNKEIPRFRKTDEWDYN